jgi:transcriptional regulator with XRE-family HTH domain
LNSKEGLIRRLRKGRDARTRFVESHLDKKLAFQIRSLRGDSSQEEMEERTGIKQQAISRLENPYYGKATLTTLKRIAAAFDVALLVEFVPYSQLVNRVSGTPYTEHGFSPNTMNVPSFDEEDQRGIFAPTEPPVTSIEPPKPQSEALPLPNGQTERPRGQSTGLGGSGARVYVDESGSVPNIPLPPPIASQQSRGGVL